jgi:hypothetical protein
LSMTHAIFSVIRQRVADCLQVQQLANTGTSDR